MLQGSPEIQRRARRLRKEMSLPEVLLGQRLKGRPNGLKFRRQHPAGDYVLDFYCHEARLVVEIDGISHSMGDCPSKDDRRDRWLITRGLQVLRIAAADVLSDVVDAAASIVAAAQGSI